jgi:hypothetical protein
MCWFLHSWAKQTSPTCSVCVYARVMSSAFWNHFAGHPQCLPGQSLAKHPWEHVVHTAFPGGSTLQWQTGTLVSWRLREARAICLASFRASILMMASSNSSCPRGGVWATHSGMHQDRHNASHIQEMNVPHKCTMTGTQGEKTHARLSLTMNTSADHEIRA